MSAVSGMRPVCTESVQVNATVRWRVSASAITLPEARPWLNAQHTTDATLVCEVTATPSGMVCAEFFLEAADRRFPICTAVAEVVRHPPLTHLDAFDEAGNRLLAATISETRTLYAVTTLWDRLGVPGGRYQLA